MMPSQIQPQSLFTKWSGRFFERAKEKGYKPPLGYLCFFIKFCWVATIDVIARHCPIPVLRETLYRSMSVKVGKGTFIDRDVYLDVVWPEFITIGAGCSIAQCSILLCHEYDLKQYKRGDLIHNIPHRVKPIQIGDNVMVGSRAMILPGVTIGEGCIIGAGAMVNKDIPSWSIAVGSPARVIRNVTADE